MEEKGGKEKKKKEGEQERRKNRKAVERGVDEFSQDEKIGDNQER